MNRMSDCNSNDVEVVAKTGQESSTSELNKSKAISFDINDQNELDYDEEENEVKFSTIILYFD